MILEQITLFILGVVFFILLQLALKAWRYEKVLNRLEDNPVVKREQKSYIAVPKQKTVEEKIEYLKSLGFNPFFENGVLKVGEMAKKEDEKEVA